MQVEYLLFASNLIAFFNHKAVSLEQNFLSEHRTVVFGQSTPSLQMCTLSSDIWIWARQGFTGRTFSAAAPCLHPQCHTHTLSCRKTSIQGGASARLPSVAFEWEHLCLSVISHSWTTWTALHLNRAGLCLFHTEQVFLLVSYSPWQFLLQWDVIFMLGKPSKELVGWAVQWQKCPSDWSSARILITASASYTTYHCSFYSFICFSLSLQLLLLIS